MKKIVLYPNAVLRQKTPEMRDLSKANLSQIKELNKTLEDVAGVGLAATQLGYKSRFLGIKNDERKVRIYINPRIEQVFGEKSWITMIGENNEREDFLEGCLSFPNLWGTVKRYLKIKASWQEVIKNKLDNKEEIIEGMNAVVFQHELDHLDGILFIDRIKEDGGKFYRFMGKKMVKWSLDEVISLEKK